MRRLLKNTRTYVLFVLLLPFLSAGCSSEDLVQEEDLVTDTETEIETEITDVAWQLIEINGAQPDETSQPIDLTLDTLNHTTSGFGGCNRYSGSFEQNEETFSFGPIAATRMYCENTMSVEDAFFASLSNVTRAVVDGSSLTMFDETGAPILSFKKGS